MRSASYSAQSILRDLYTHSRDVMTLLLSEEKHQYHSVTV